MSFLKSSFSFIRSLITLTRFVLSISVGFSGFVSYIKFSGSINSASILIFIGIFLLAAGASSLNQFQEKNYDARMKRTMKRPLPLGVLSGSTAVIISILLMIPGLFILFYFGGTGSFIAGLFSILWYNILYTYLKRNSAFALFPGVLTGVIPVLIGWLAAGGEWTDTDFLLISAFMCLWQIPHFLLLMLNYQDDYRKAGFPLLTERFSRRSLKNMILFSAFLMVIIIRFLIYYGVFLSLSIKLLSIAFTLFMLLFLIIKISDRKEVNYKPAMMVLNSYMLGIMVLLLTDSLMNV